MKYYKKSDEVNGRFYQSPSWIRKNFLDVEIESKEILFEAGDRLDIIAQQLYGDPSYWKAIALFNNIGYMFELQPGDRLYLPLRIKEVTDRL